MKGYAVNMPRFIGAFDHNSIEMYDGRDPLFQVMLSVYLYEHFGPEPQANDMDGTEGLELEELV